MTTGNGLPCKKCGTSEWYSNGNCKKCKQVKNKQWNELHPAQRAKLSRDWFINNPGKHNESCKRWASENKDKVVAYANSTKAKGRGGGSYTALQFDQLCSEFGDKCLKCGSKEKMTADHIIPVTLGGTSNIENIQPLCQSCNSSKGTKTTDYRTMPMAERFMQLPFIMEAVE